MASSSGGIQKDQNYKLIPEVLKNELGWTAKVVVAEKTAPRQSARSPTKYQSLLLVDPKGNKVRACIFNANIAAFQNKLQLNKTYLVSNAYVKEVKAEFRQKPDELEWTIDAKTVIQEVNENNDAVLDSTYKFTPFDQLQLHIDKPYDINVLAPVIDIRPKKKIQLKSGESGTLQEVILLDQHFRTLVLTMWDAFVDNECATISNIIHRKPIIAGLRLRAVSHNACIHIQTKPMSCFIIDPQIPSAMQLRNWVTDNATKLSEIACDKKHINSAIRLQLPPTDQIVPIGDINDMLITRTSFWVKGFVDVNNYGQPFCYVACDKCHRAIGREAGDIFECIFCNASQAKAIHWLRVEVNVRDSTGVLLATTFGLVAEQLFDCTANNFFKLKTEATDQTSLQAVLNGSAQNEHVIYLKSSKTEVSYSETTKFILIFASKTTSAQPILQSHTTEVVMSLNPSNVNPLDTAGTKQSDDEIKTVQQTEVEVVQGDTSAPTSKRLKIHENPHV